MTVLIMRTAKDYKRLQRAHPLTSGQWTMQPANNYAACAGVEWAHLLIFVDFASVLCQLLDALQFVLCRLKRRCRKARGHDNFSCENNHVAQNGSQQRSNARALLPYQGRSSHIGSVGMYTALINSHWVVVPKQSIAL